MNQPTAAQVAEFVAYFEENAFGFDGPRDCAEIQYPGRPESFYDALAAATR